MGSGAFGRIDFSTSFTYYLGMSETSLPTETTHREQALHAWREATGFIPLLERPNPPSVFIDHDDQQYLWTRRGIAGRESLLSRRFFEHMTLELDDSHKENASEDISWLAVRRDLDTDDIHRRTVFEIGTNNTFTPPVEAEFIHFLSENTPSALSYALALNVGRRTLEATGWNNGSDIDIDLIVEAVEAFMGGSSREFNRDALDPNKTFSAQYVARHALYSRGTVVFANGDQATTLSTYEDFSLKRRDRTISPIEGNVIYTSVPFYAGEFRTDDYVPFHAKNSPLPKVLRRMANGSSHPLYSMVYNGHSVERFLEERDQS